ncbi:MAG: NlpC/P60 family protein [Bacilli bacterium]|nr:NlpC/P60 family protein [Bacilli bacterium]
MNPKNNELMDANNEEMKQQNQEEKNQETNKKVAKTAAKAAANYFAPGVGGSAVDAIAKTEIGNKVFDKGGKIVTDLTNRHPLGGMLQNTLNKADDSGSLDLADPAIGGMGGATSNASNGIASSLGNVNSLMSSTNKDNSSSGGDYTKIAKDIAMKSIMKHYKKYIFIGVGAILFVLVVIIILNPFDMLNLTDGSGNKNTASSNYNLIVSDDQIEKLLIYVGDSRINNIKNTINKSEITYMAQDGSGYVWFSDDTVLNELQSYIGADTTKYVIFSFGINDLNNIDKYINVYNTLINNYKNVKFYFMSVNPINEELAIANGFNITNEEIMAFNTKLSSAFTDSYIDVYSQIVNNFSTDDGVHYNNETNQKIHNIVLQFIKSHNTYRFLDIYPSINGTTNLHGQSLLSVIGESGIAEIEAYIQEKIDFSGKCTASAVAGASVGLIDGLSTKGVSIPYYWGGRYNGEGFIDKNWGSFTSGSYSGKNMYFYSGLDCSGFVHWALRASSINSDAGSAASYLNYGNPIIYENAYPGALLVNQNHIAIIIEINENQVQAAESTTGGVQFKSYTKSKINQTYTIIDMASYYQLNCMV